MKRISKAICLMLAAAFVAFNMAGCISYVAIDEYGYVMTVGVDKGETYDYRFCFIVQVEGASQGESDAENVVLSAEGNNIYDAVAVVEVGVPYQLNFGRANYMLFSKEVAETGYIARFIDESFKNLGVRRSTKLMVVLGDSLDYCTGVVSKDNPNTSKRQYSILRDYVSEGLTPITNIAMFTQNVNAKRGDNIVTLGATDDSIPNEEITGSSQDSELNPNSTTAGVERTGGLRAYYMGCAVFDGGTMKGVLSGRDTEIILMAKGMFRAGRITLHHEGGEGHMVLLLKGGGKPKVELSIGGDAPYAKMSVRLQCHIECGEEDMDYNKWNREVKPMLEDYMEREIERVFTLCRGMNSDAYEIGKYAAMKFHSAEEWEQYDWKSRYPELNMEFDVSLYVENEEINSLGG